MSGRNNLKKLRKFLNRNQAWLCFENCSFAKPNCDMCNFIKQINYSYKSNKSANILTFQNSYLREPFNEVYNMYLHFKNNNYQNKGFCSCM